MKKTIAVILIFGLFYFNLFAENLFEKESKTKDDYAIKVYQIDKTIHPDSFEFYVVLTSTDSEEYFTWCFDKLNDALEHFKWLETKEIVNISYERSGGEALGLAVLFGQMTIEEAQKQAKDLPVKEFTIDKRTDWRSYSYDADSYESGWVKYWIAKKFRKSEYGSQKDWR